MISPENLITVTLHATVPFMGCLFIKLTPFETINLVLQRARPAPVRWEGILSFPGHTWSPLLITTPPRLLDFCLSPFSGVLSHFSNCLYDIQNLLGINGLCINIPIRYSEYLWVYFLERSIFSVEQQSTPGCPDNQSSFFFFCTPCYLESFQDIHSVSRRMGAMADFMCKDHSCTISHESSWSVPWCSVMESWMQTESKQARRKTKSWPLRNCFSSAVLFHNPAGISPWE